VRPLRLVAALGVVLATLGPIAMPVSAADAPSIEARVLVAGQARVGSWMAISVHLRNDGPAVSGELRLAGGAQSQTRFGTIVDLPTQSDKTYLLYAQPPAFGAQLDVLLVDGDRTVTTTKVTYTIHEAAQTIVAVVAERPERIVADIDLPPNQNGTAAAVVGLVPEDLPERVEAWGALDRIVWQDVDAGRLNESQLAALRGWVAAGGRLVVAGGTLGPRALNAFPDVLLPFRPSATTDVSAGALASLLGTLPASAPATVPALSGELAGGRALATAGDRVVAAERAYGAGSVSVLGFDPASDWIASSDASERLWRRVLPPRSTAGSGLAFPDDNLLVNAVGQLPTLALPPIDGLILLLAAYILLIGPINYLVLKRLDRREWAWVTMPVLILGFAVGAYAFGAALRGSEVIVNEVAIVRGAPGATDGSAQVYLGVFSPTRGVYQVRVPGGALLSMPINGEAFGGGSGTTLDVLQGEPSRVRNLAVGFGSLRAVHAETAVAVPLIDADLRLADGHLQGRIRNASSQMLERPALVLGSTVVVMNDLAPGGEQTVDVAVRADLIGQSLADRVVGQTFFEGRGAAPNASRQYVRHNMVDQLTWDQMMGTTNRLPADGPVILAWGSNDLVPIEIEGQRPNRVSNVLYYLPTRLTIAGRTTFGSDLMTSTMVESDAMMFPKEPSMITFGRGTATYAYRPVAFEGRLTATELTMALNFRDQVGVDGSTNVEPLPSVPPACPDPPTDACRAFDGMPDIELFDLQSRTWRRLPHLAQSQRVSVAEPARFVDAASGTVLVRYVNDHQEPVAAAPDVTITGTIE
jgi:hypothetical protein